MSSDVPFRICPVNTHRDSECAEQGSLSEPYLQIDVSECVHQSLRFMPQIACNNMARDTKTMEMLRETKELRRKTNDSSCAVRDLRKR